MTKQYEYEIPDEGLSYDVLDVSFNPTTREVINKHLALRGMHVLDIGSGSGMMTHFLSQCVGDEGSVTTVDMSKEQLNRAKNYCQRHGRDNIRYVQMDASEIKSLAKSFDMIYCRFVLHHLQNPRQMIDLIHGCLKEGGYYVAEEGLVNQAFAYPPTIAWQFEKPQINYPEDDVDGDKRDGNFGMRLLHWMKKTGFEILDTKLVQPMLHTKEQKKLLLDGHYAYKSTLIEQGMSEEQWNQQSQAYHELIEDD